jgi:hypothetical protein
MNQSDIIVLESLKPHMSDFVYAMVIQAVEKAGSIREVTDKSVMFELVKAKQSFGGNRSAAGAYAASVRWGKKTQTESGGATATGGGAAAEPEKPRYSSAFNDDDMLDETETSINRAYDKSGFGEEKGDALGAVEGTRQTLYEARRSLESGIPIETVRGGLVKEQKRLKSLSTRTRKKGEDLQTAEGGPKKDANGKWIMTRSARYFTDAQVIKNMAAMLERTIRKLDALRP